MTDGIIDKFDNDERIKLIKPFVREFDAYVVGGFVRDMFLGVHSCDIDLIVSCSDVKEFSKSLAAGLNAHFVELDAVNNIYRIVLDDKVNYFDITSPVDNDLELDIKRRDLTVNAVAYDINKKEIVDLTGGVDDIKNGIIRGINEKNFEDDPLRLIRIFRFFSQTGFEIDENLLTTAKKYAERINEPAKERINRELLKMFDGKYCSESLLKLDECNLLEKIFPCLSEIKKIPPNTHHHLSLFEHLIETVRQIQIIYENSNGEVRQYLESQKYGTVKEKAFLKLAGFLHDIGKPVTWKIEPETGRHRFIGHDNEGAKLVVPLLKSLKFSKKQIEYIQNMVKYHIYPSSMVSSEGISEKTFMKFYRKTEGFVIDVIILAMADRLSARGVAVTEDMINENISNLENLLNTYLEMRKNIKPVEKLLDGIEIMEILNMKQGPELGKIISALYEAQISSEVNTRKDAIEFITKFKSL